MRQTASHPAPELAHRVLTWHAGHGRHDLPWQRPRTPYRVWISEVMLQQTRVETVIPYFERFVDAFADVAELAAAAEDDVLALWSGLGYYRRARHLHQAAREVVEHHDGTLPDTVAALAALPGIGRSTAGAIASLGSGVCAPILDGNVKRLFCRHFGIDGWPGASATLKSLWTLAESHLPRTRADDYNQGLMDLGATCCTLSKPACTACPLAASCVALATGRVDALPEKRPRKTTPLRAVRVLLAVDPQGRLLLERRPPSGVWGGLHSLPECAPDDDLEAWCQRYGLIQLGTAEPWPRVRHLFTHFRLDIEPLALRVSADATQVNAADHRGWYKTPDALRLGLPAPVRRLVERLDEEI